jgi:hypothetical protein
MKARSVGGVDTGSRQETTCSSGARSESDSMMIYGRNWGRSVSGRRE